MIKEKRRRKVIRILLWYLIKNKSAKNIKSEDIKIFELKYNKVAYKYGKLHVMATSNFSRV